MADSGHHERTPEAEFIEGVIGWVQSLPVAWAQGLTMVMFLGLLLVCWVIPRTHVLADAPPERWRDLRIWATVLIVLQLGLYRLFS